MEQSISSKLNKLTITISLCFSILFSIFAIYHDLIQRFIPHRILLYGVGYSIGPLISLIVYKKNPTYRHLNLLTLCGNLLFYSLLLTSTYRDYLYPYGYCLFILYFLYGNKKLLGILLGGITFANILSIIVTLVTHEKVMTYQSNYSCEKFLVGLFIFIFFFILLKLINLSKEDNNLKIAQVAAEKEKQSELLQSIIEATKVLDCNCEKVQQIVAQFSTSSSSVNYSISQIAEGAKETALTIQNQLDMTHQIQEHINITHADFSKMNVSLKQSNVQFAKANSLIHSLSEKAELTEKISASTQVVIEELKNQSLEIHQITSLITQIAEQTTLLSLNAAIESARAGEAGRGFTVVTKEIGALAIRSQESAQNISLIINELQQKAEATAQAVTQLSDVSKEQYELITETSDTFSQIMQSIKEVKSNTENVGLKLNDVIEANTNIVTSINDISVVSQQTTSNSDKAAIISVQNAQLAHEAVNHVNELIQISNKMSQYLP